MFTPLVHSPAELLESIAMVNTRLYGQLLAQGRPEHELELIRRAYDLASFLYAGAHQPDGRPFTAHAVSVASALTLLGLPSSMVAAALVHNVYNNGDFGDGLHDALTPARRHLVAEAVGEEIEGYVVRFRSLRLNREIESWGDVERNLMILELADKLDKYVDMNLLFAGDAEWVKRFMNAHEAELVDIAGRLGQPVLAGALTLAVARAEKRGSVPTVLRSEPHRKYAYRIQPASLTLRPKLALKGQSVTWPVATTLPP